MSCFVRSSSVPPHRKRWKNKSYVDLTQGIWATFGVRQPVCHRKCFAYDNYMTINIEHWKTKLEEEKLSIENQLGQVGRINPDDKTDWEPVAADLNSGTAEIEDRASEIADFEDRSAVEFELETRLGKIVDALGRIDSKTYGVCSVCNSEIEAERLEVNPAATTCKQHRG